MPKPDLTRIPQYYHRYVAQVQEDDLLKAFTQYQPQNITFFRNIPNEKWNHRYAEGKWTIKEMVQHIIDAERIFQYRALRFARRDKTQLPGFDENLFAANSDAEKRSKDDLINELSVVQQSSLVLFQSFTNEQLNASGIASDNEVYVEGIGFILIGHTLHHINVLKERYL